MRRFCLVRSDDVSGVSGLGVVADGVLFDDGMVAIHWRTRYGGTEIYRRLKQAEECHGHEGKTRIVWIDEVSSTKGSVYVPQRIFGSELYMKDGRVYRLDEYSFKPVITQDGGS